MKNTGVTYSSAERTPTVLREMAELLPPLTEEQLAMLEADLLKNGCYSPIIVSEDLLIIDGHNRQSLCEKHGIPYQMAVFSFEDMLEAKQWALDTQKGRRNLDKWELGKIALKLKPDLEARAKENMSAGGGDQKSEDAKSGSAILPNPISPVDTRKDLANAVGLGERTMGKVMQIDEHAPPAVKEALDNKELSINQGYNITKQVQELPEEQRAEAAAQAVELEKAKKEIRQSDAESDRRHKIAGQFCKGFEKAVLLTPTEENVRIWVECTRMTTEEIEDSVKEARELSEVFSTIADILEQMLPPAEEAEQ
jgi:ribosome recycling factor